MNLFRALRLLTRDIVATSPRSVAGSIVLMLAISSTEGLGLLLLMPLLGLVGIDQPHTTMPNVAGWFDRVFAFVHVEPSLGAVLLMFVCIAAFRALLQRWQGRLNASLREGFTARLRLRVYRAIAGAQWKFLVTRRASEFAHVLAGEVGQIGSAASQVIDLAVLSAVSLVYLGLAFHLSPVMAALVLSCAGGLAWAVRGKIDEARATGARASGARSRLYTVIAEHIGSMKTAKTYGAVDRHADIFSRIAHELRDASLEVNAGETDLQQSLEVGSTALLALIVYMSFEILGVSAAQILVLLFIFSRLMPRLVTIYRRVQTLASTVPVMNAVAVLERECLLAAEPGTGDGNADQDVSLSRSIRFDDVSFTYLKRSAVPAVSDLNLDIEAGLTTAIVGSSGAGKSTLADLLIGVLTPTSGRVLIDGEPLHANRLAGWRRHLSYVPQDTFLFHDTIRANLEWAHPGATDDELWHALKLAAADEFVMALAQGLDTVVGERGVLVSGGERQRLSLARALLRRPRVLVLDEATSSLDSETERRIQRAIDGLHREMTIVIVTHRLSMISGADVIHVLERGRVIESGSWDDLMGRPNGRFVELCRAQGIHRRPAVEPTPLRPRWMAEHRGLSQP